MIRLTSILIGVSLAFLECVVANGQTVGWPVYNGQAEADHYSRLSQINQANVQRLQVAWTFDTGEKGDIQTNPLIIGRTLYAYTSTQKVIALDASTGKLRWEFDSGIQGTQPARGVAYYSDGKDEFIFAGIMNFLYCIDARTGKPVSSFGEGGRIDLRNGLAEFRGEDFQRQSIALTTPGVIYKDLIIVGGRNPETHPAPPGDIRAFDIHTGAMRWTFHTIPRPGEPGYETWPADAWKTAGAANNWAGMSLDAAHGIVYIPTGSAVMDFYGGDRLGNDLYANSLLALDAATGKLLWHFQGVHHDLWDRDFPAQPTLFTLRRNRKSIPAIAQISKQSYVFVFDRLTGEPLFPIHEHPYPASTVPGEVTSPTQPLPDAPAPFGRQFLSGDMLTNRTPEVHAWAVSQFRTYASGGQFVPFSLDKLTVVLPGFDGGGEWGGAALDPATDVLYVGSSEMANVGGLLRASGNSGRGARIYQNQCAICHGVTRAGAPPAFPSLLGVLDRMTAEQAAEIVKNGRGRMPAVANLDDAAIGSLLDYLRSGTAASGQQAEAGTQSERSELQPKVPDARAAQPYVFSGYRKFLDPDGYPAIAPPWGTLNAIDLRTGKYLWKITLGEYPDLVKQGMTNTGSELYGGPIVTAGGVLFIGATVYDRKFHAFDSRTGKLLWQTTLPFAGIATPSTYMVDGRQYVVIAASGGRDPKGPVGGEYIAFALPK